MLKRKLLQHEQDTEEPFRKGFNKEAYLKSPKTN